MKKSFLIILYLISIVFSQNKDISHSTFHIPHLRIVSLAPSATNQMLALEIDNLLVGKTAYCPKNAGNNKIGDYPQVIGDVINISGESVLALKPDIVLAGGLTNKNLLERLQKSNVSVFVIQDPKNYEELCENFRNIAEICGVLPKADSILTEIDKKYLQIKEENTNIKNRRKIFIQLSTNPIYTIMKNTLGNEIIEASGGINSFDLSSGAVVSREAVIAANPDLILVANMERLSQKEIAKWKKFAAVSAVKNNAVFIFDGYEIGSPTPASFIKTIEKIRGM
jgi:iron complex transport system substrate-binding protein